MLCLEQTAQNKNFILQKQWRQANFLIDITKAFINTMHYWLLIIFSFMLQRQHIRCNFMT